MANAARQEIDIPFNGKVYTVRPTFETVAGIEGATGQASAALAKKFYANEPSEYPSLTITAQVVYQLLQPVDKNLTPEIVGTALMEDGCDELWVPLGDFLARALKGNKAHMRKAQEAAQNDISVKNPPQGQDGST